MNDSRPPKPKRQWHEFGLKHLVAVVPVLLVHFGCGSPNGEQAMDADNQQQALAAFNRGLSHDAKGEFVKASADYTAVIQREPESADTFAMRAHAYRASGDEVRAISDETTAINLGATVLHGNNDQ